MVKFDRVQTKSRRLRKKLYLGEFQELGFYVSAKYREKLTSDATDKDADEFVAFAVANQLCVYGVHVNDGFGCTLRHEIDYRNVDIQQYEAMVEWVKNHPMVDPTTVKVSPLFDIHYADDEVWDSLIDPVVCGFGKGV